MKSAEIVEMPEFNGYKNVKFLKVEGDRVRFSHSDGINLVYLNALPSDLKSRILRVLPSVDPKAGEQALKEQEAKEIQEKAISDFKEKFGARMFGRIVQVTKDGVLISRASLQYNAKVKKVETRTIRKPILGSGNMMREAQYEEVEIPQTKMVEDSEYIGDGILIFVKCDTKGLFDDKYVSLDVFPVGTHSYNSLGSVVRTVRAYTTNMEDAMLHNSKLEDAGK